MYEIRCTAQSEINTFCILTQYITLIISNLKELEPETQKNIVCWRVLKYQSPIESEHKRVLLVWLFCYTLHKGPHHSTLMGNNDNIVERAIQSIFIQSIQSFQRIFILDMKYLFYCIRKWIMWTKRFALIVYIFLLIV